MAKLQKPSPNPTGTIKKPAQPPKDGKKKTTTLNGVTWNYFQKCFGGKGSWNKTHTNSEHVKGTGKGYKNGKEENPPIPGVSNASPDTLVANLASTAAETAGTNDNSGLFFLSEAESNRYASIQPIT